MYLNLGWDLWKKIQVLFINCFFCLDQYVDLVIDDDKKKHLFESKTMVNILLVIYLEQNFVKLIVPTVLWIEIPFLGGGGAVQSPTIVESLKFW